MINSWNSINSRPLPRYIYNTSPQRLIRTENPIKPSRPRRRETYSPLPAQAMLPFLHPCLGMLPRTWEAISPVPTGLMPTSWQTMQTKTSPPPYAVKIVCSSLNGLSPFCCKEGSRTTDGRIGTPSSQKQRHLLGNRCGAVRWCAVPAQTFKSIQHGSFVSRLSQVGGTQALPNA